MIKLFNELKRRNVFKVSIAYLALGWLVVQITSVAVPALNLPNSLNSIVFYLGIVGFPFAILFAWAYELTPDGVKKTTKVITQDELDKDGVSKDTENIITGHKIDFVIITILSLAVVVLLFRQTTTESPSPSASTSVEGLVEPAKQQSLNQTTEINNKKISIAVLPLMNLSNHNENLFFASGVHEDILTNLSKIKSLSVISRTSVMRYSTSDMSIPEIGQKIGANYIVEGSVRRIQNHVRVTVQLINAQNDSHLWANNYDRELADVFAIQSAIAQDISNAIINVLLPNENTTSMLTPAHKTLARELYQKAKGIYRSELESEQSVTKQRDLLERAVEEDPELVEAWALLNEVYDAILRRLPQSRWFMDKDDDLDTIFQQYRAKGVNALEKAIALDPNNTETLMARASGIIGDGYLLESPKKAFRLRKKTIDLALSIHPEYAPYWYSIGWWHSFDGDDEKAQNAFEKALEYDPFNAQIVNGIILFYRGRGQTERADLLYKDLAKIAPEIAQIKGGDNARPDVLIRNMLWRFINSQDPILITKSIEVLNNKPNFEFGIYERQNFNFIIWQLSKDESFLNEFVKQDITFKKEQDLFITVWPDHNFLNRYLQVKAKLILHYLFLNENSKAKQVALEMLKYKDYDAYRLNPIAINSKSAMVLAHVVLDQHKQAEEIVAQINTLQAEYHFPYSLDNIFSTSLIDVEKAVNMFFATREKHPNWFGLNVIPAYHFQFRTLLLHPKIKNYYKNDPQWSNYLFERIPEYEN